MVKILELWPHKNIPVVDLGCGHNFYSNVLCYAGYDSVGVDGNTLNGYRTDIIEADLTEKHVDEIYDPEGPTGLRKITLQEYLSGRCKGFDKPANVISMEVGEHIPDELSGNYLNNITSFSRDIIMSWAVPGQAGVGHINCRPLEWVTSRMFDRGYILDHEKTDELRECVKGCHCSWLQNTLMYFKPNI